MRASLQLLSQKYNYEHILQLNTEVNKHIKTTQDSKNVFAENKTLNTRHLRSTELSR